MIHAKHYASSGPNLIIIHGLFGNADNWHSIAQNLCEHFCVYCVDLPNHGKSAPMLEASYPNMAKAILQWAKQTGLDDFFLLGHSMGGKVAMQMTALAPDRINKLIVADIAPVDYQPGHNQIFAGLQAIDEADIQSRQQADKLLAQYEPSAPIRQFLLKNLTRSEHGFSLSIARENIANNYQNILSKPQISQPITTPTLFIKGEKSDYIVADYQPAIISLFPNASVKIIPNTGHWLHAEKPVPFTSLVRRFFQLIK